MPKSRKSFALGAGGSIVLILAMASLAMAEEVTRDSYTAAVEPICKTNTRADEKLFESGAAALKANSKVLSFGFRYCKLEPLKFT